MVLSKQHIFFDMIGHSISEDREQLQMYASKRNSKEKEICFRRKNLAQKERFCFKLLQKRKISGCCSKIKKSSALLTLDTLPHDIQKAKYYEFLSLNPHVRERVILWKRGYTYKTTFPWRGASARIWDTWVQSLAKDSIPEIPRVKAVK